MANSQLASRKTAAGAAGSAALLLAVLLVAARAVSAGPAVAAAGGEGPEAAGLESARARQAAVGAEQDVAELVAAASAARAAARYQRSVLEAQQYAAQQQQLQLQQQQQLLADEEAALRRQLPDLIAQARSDKHAERALLRMLINLSQRASLANLAPYRAAELAGAAESPRESAPTRPMSRLDELLAEWGASGEAGPASGPEFWGQGSGYQALAKREYIKPCSFNAVSCAKNPFRRL